jgi:hypothetical protein
LRASFVCCFFDLIALERLLDPQPVRRRKLSLLPRSGFACPDFQIPAYGVRREPVCCRLLLAGMGSLAGAWKGDRRIDGP